MKQELTERENFFLVYNRQTPAWTPNFFTAYSPFGTSLLNNTGEYMRGGEDMFGARWLCTEDTGWQPIPDPKFHLIEDITEWRDYIHFPDLDAMDWEGEPWFQALRPYLPQLSPVALSKGTPLDFTDGERPCYLYFLLRGSFKVCGNLPDGKRLLLRFDSGFMLLGEFELFGDSTVLPRPQSDRADIAYGVETVSPCLALRLNYSRIRDRLLADPVFLRLIVDSLAEKSRAFSNAQITNALLSAERRTAVYLLYSADKNGRFAENLRLMAEQLNLSYRHLHRCLDALCRTGCLCRTDRGFQVTDRAALRRLAEEGKP